MSLNTIELPDDELAAACAGRDESPQKRRAAESAFRTLYDRHAKRLLAFLSARVNQAALDDVHQEVWTKVWRAVPDFRGGNFRAWIHQIARNLIIDQRRKRRHESLTEEGDLIDERQWEASESVEAELRDALAHCLKKLERANARVADLVRSRVAGESYDAFCTRSGMAADRAYRAFHQAKALLQACVEENSQ